MDLEPHYIPAQVCGSTLVGYSKAGGFPIDSGNCMTLVGHRKCANMTAENLAEWVRRNPDMLNLQVKDVYEGCCIVVDERIPKEWLTDKVCSTCFNDLQKGLIYEAMGHISVESIGGNVEDVEEFRDHLRKKAAGEDLLNKLKQNYTLEEAESVEAVHNVDILERLLSIAFDAESVCPTCDEYLESCKCKKT